jgi:predicted RNA binding protein YcfA (HicA-like mRNA interferase family)
VSALPRISERQVVQTLKKIGCEQDRQRDSPMILRQTDSPHRRLTAPAREARSIGSAPAPHGKETVAAPKSFLNHGIANIGAGTVGFTGVVEAKCGYDR